MIYVTGDSFCWGDEIADYIVPEWPGYQPLNRSEQIDWSLSRTLFINEYKEKHDKIRIENRWGTLLGNHLGMDVINSSFPGKSIHNMLTCMAHDLPKLTNVKYVIVQLTGLYRFQIPRITEIHENIQFQKGYAQINPLADTNHVSEIKEISKLRVNLNNDIDFLYDYLNTIYLMQLLSKGITKNNLIILDSIFLTDFGNILKIIEQEKKNNDILNLLKLTNFVEEVNKFPTMNQIYLNNKNICNSTPSGHFCINTHKIFAEQVAKKIKE